MCRLDRQVACVKGSLLSFSMVSAGVAGTQFIPRLASYGIPDWFAGGIVGAATCSVLYFGGMAIYDNWAWKSLPDNKRFQYAGSYEFVTWKMMPSGHLKKVSKGTATIRQRASGLELHARPANNITTIDSQFMILRDDGPGHLGYFGLYGNKRVRGTAEFTTTYLNNDPDQGPEKIRFLCTEYLGDSDVPVLLITEYTKVAAAQKAHWLLLFQYIFGLRAH